MIFHHTLQEIHKHIICVVLLNFDEPFFPIFQFFNVVFEDDLDQKITVI